MNKSIQNLKTEPDDSSNEQFSTANIKVKQELELEIKEIDDTIFMQECLESSKKVIDSNIYRSTEDIEFNDEIIKEEPIFYDAIENQVLLFHQTEDTTPINTEYVEFTTNSECNERIHEETFECYICKCKTINIGLLKWHLLERHSEKPLLEDQHLTNGKLKNKDSKINDNQNNRSGTQKHQLNTMCRTPTIHQQKKPNKEKHNLHGPSIEREFKCSYCGRKFDTIQRVKKHERVHTKTQPFKCSLCPKRYNHKANLYEHSRIHSGKTPYSCNMCENEYSSYMGLYKHKKSHANGKMSSKRKSQQSNIIINNIEPNDYSAFHIFECYLCRSRCHKSTIQIHMKENHTGERLFQCDICLKKFVHKNSIHKHMNTHSRNNFFECTVCGKLLSGEKGLSLHIQTHKGEYIHNCKYCHKKYSTKKILRDHIRTHTGLKPYECEYCKKGFVRRADMIRHTMIHTGERPYKCDICDSSFSRNHLLTDHKRNIHFRLERKLDLINLLERKQTLVKQQTNKLFK